MTAPEVQTIGVRAATAAALPTYVYDPAARTYTAAANGRATLDGVALSVGDLALVQTESDGTKHGVVIVRVQGDATTPFVLQRSSSCCSGLQLANGLLIAVAEGSTYGGRLRRLTTSTRPIVIDYTALSFGDAGAGSMSGPGSSTAHASAVFADTSGAVLDVVAGSYDASGSANTTDGTTTVTVLSVDVATALGGDGGALLEVDLIGVRQGTLETAAWRFVARVKVASGTLTLQSPRPLAWQDRDSGSGIAAATAALAASSGSLNVNVVGIAGSTIRWTARARGIVRTQA